MKTNPCESVFEPLLNSTETAKLLGVNPGTVHRLARAGQIPCIKVGKLWRFSASQLSAWVSSSSNAVRKSA